MGCRMQESQCHLFLFLKVCPLIHIFTSFPFSESKSKTVRDILIAFGRIIEQVNAACRMQE